MWVHFLHTAPKFGKISKSGIFSGLITYLAKNSVLIFIVIIGQTLKISSSHLSGHTVIIVLLMLGAPKGKVINISLWQWRQCRGWSSEHGNDVQCMDLNEDAGFAVSGEKGRKRKRPQIRLWSLDTLETFQVVCFCSFRVFYIVY